MTTVLTATSRGLLARRGSTFCHKVAYQPKTAMRVRTSANAAYPPVATATKARNPFSRAFQWYGEKLDTHPIITKALTAGTIGALGDVMCQVTIDKPEKEFQREQKHGMTDHEPFLWWFEPARSGRFFILGVALVGPWCHAWFGALARWYPKLTPTSIITRVALDQFAFTPIILSTWVSSLWALEGAMGDASESAKDTTIPARLAEAFPDLVVANWILWGPVQLINFRLVPQKYQVLFANMISLVWNAYLSFSTRAHAGEVEYEVEQEILMEAPLAMNLIQREAGLIRRLSTTEA